MSSFLDAHSIAYHGRSSPKTSGERRLYADARRPLFTVMALLPMPSSSLPRVDGYRLKVATSQ